MWLLLIRLIRANAVCSVLRQLFGAATATRARRAETLGAGRRTRQSEKCRGGAEVRGSSWSCRHTADKPPEVCIFGFGIDHRSKFSHDLLERRQPRLQLRAASFLGDFHQHRRRQELPVGAFENRRRLLQLALEALR